MLSMTHEKVWEPNYVINVPAQNTIMGWNTVSYFKTSPLPCQGKEERELLSSTRQLSRWLLFTKQSNQSVATRGLFHKHWGRASDKRRGKKGKSLCWLNEHARHVLPEVVIWLHTETNTAAQEPQVSTHRTVLLSLLNTIFFSSLIVSGWWPPFSSFRIAWCVTSSLPPLSITPYSPQFLLPNSPKFLSPFFLSAWPSSPGPWSAFVFCD